VGLSNQFPKQSRTGETHDGASQRCFTLDKREDIQRQSDLELLNSGH
jgi:hypothetical protein